MQSTEIDALLRDLEESRLHAQSAHLFRSAELTFRAITALAAERDRADRAEARLADAWDEGERYGTKYFGQHSFMPVNPYRSEATA